MIRITDRFYINATGKCYMLVEKSVVQDENAKNFGKETFIELGYYTTLESCLNGLIKTKLREFISKKEENSINELIQEQQRLEDLIKTLNLKD